MQEYKNKKVLVTGGTGLIGRQVVDLLVEYGADVTSISLDIIDINPEVWYAHYDLRDSDVCLVATRNVDYVFHLAGIKTSLKITLERPATMSIPALQINTNVLEACRINGIKNVLFTSSIGAYAEAEILKEENAYLGEPMDCAGHVKRMAEYQIQWYQKEYGLNYRVVRLSSVMGIGDNFNPDNAMFIPSLMAKVLRGDCPVNIWGSGEAIRDIAYSKDIAHGILLMMLNAKDCYPINLGSGQGYSVREIVDIFRQIQDFSVLYDLTKPTGVKKRVLDISKARSLGYDPKYSLYEGLKETWEWFKENNQEQKGRLNYFENNNK